MRTAEEVRSEQEGPIHTFFLTWKMMPLGTFAPTLLYKGSPNSILTTSFISITMWSRPAMSLNLTPVSLICCLQDREDLL